MLFACFDPEDNKNFKVEKLTPNQIFAFTFNEWSYKIVSILTKQV